MLERRQNGTEGLAFFDYLFDSLRRQTAEINGFFHSHGQVNLRLK